MKKPLYSYIFSLAIMFLVIAVYPSDLMLWLGAVVFATMCFLSITPVMLVSTVLAFSTFTLIASDMIYGFLTALCFVLPGMAVGFGLRKQRSYSQIVVYGSIAALIANLIRLYYGANSESMTIVQYIIDMNSEVASLMTTGLKGIENYSDAVNELIKMFTPAMLMVQALAFGFFTFVGTRKMIERGPIRIVGTRFHELSAGRVQTIISLAVILFAFATGGTLKIIFMNATVVIAVIYALLGMSATMRLLMRTKIDSAVLRWFILIVLCLILSYIGYAIVGILSSLFGRRVDKNEGSTFEGR
ncbi:MAG: DUF2232 domain-containing protein [Bacillota bacterium]|nr:DUF2232 domain-containing protein [Bacillota bacterium]